MRVKGNEKGKMSWLFYGTDPLGRSAIGIVTDLAEIRILADGFKKVAKTLDLEGPGNGLLQSTVQGTIIFNFVVTLLKGAAT